MTHIVNHFISGGGVELQMSGPSAEHESPEWLVVQQGSAERARRQGQATALEDCGHHAHLRTGYHYSCGEDGLFSKRFESTYKKL